MVGCRQECKKWSAFSVSLVLIAFGICLVIFWEGLCASVKYESLTITNGSKAYNIWQDIPIPMYLSFYLFNWTNAHEVVKDWRIKPVFVECGPYVFREHHKRINVTWTENDTVTYFQRRTWFYQPDMSNGSLDDPITTLNIIAATIGYIVKDRNVLIRKGIDFILNREEKSLILTKSARQWMFDGFEDDLLNLAKKLNISGMNFSKFAWFYGRNNSDTYDGKYTMYTGKSDLELLGLIELWNNRPYSPFYNSYCGIVNGTSGELFPPVERYRSVSIFSSDICSSLKLFHDPNISVDYTHGVSGKTFVGTDFLFDNGSKYPEQKCFKGDSIFPSGVRDISKCRFGAPAFISFPHFLHGDPWYTNNVVGMHPNSSEHGFQITIEPNTGVPLDVNARLQINMLIQPIDGLRLFQNVKKVMFPMLWFKQSAVLTSDIAIELKLLIVLPKLGTYTGYGFISIGLLIATISIYLTVKKAWKDMDSQQLLSEKAL